ncbi:ATP-binding cassette domain-containing protein [Sulfitobacter sp. BDSS02]|nr:ATP-binding cassette domain-containing protein [Sulfitobacter sp. BDSS02]MBR9852712.1 ABC transporter ATP-binding protein [Paracoccaceae bacterium]
MIRVDVTGKSFGGSPVLGPCGFEIASGECVALTGPSGIGKTTLLRIVAGIDDRFSGNIERPDNIAMVFQEPTLLLWRSVIENLTLIHPSLSRAEAFEMLARVGIADKADLFPTQLSLGQQRRLTLARAFAGQPEFLIMDEPLVSLDHETAQSMLRLIEELIAATKPAVLFVTHTLSDAERLATRILELRGSPATPTELSRKDIL